jgi:hypothetical protein
LSDEKYILALHALAELSIGEASPAQRDHVIRVDTISPQPVKQTEREIFVEKYPHDARRTAGGKCVVT